MFAVISRQQLLGPKVADLDGVAAGQRMPLVDDELKILGEQWPGIEPVPVLADFGGNAEFGFALLQILADFAGVAAQEAEFQPVELPLDLVEMRNQEREIDRMGQCDPERTDFAALEGGGKHARSARRLIALLQQRPHALAELGQLRCGAFAPEQVAAELSLELLDRPRQRWLGDVALVGGAREIQRPCDGEEVTYLVHFHDRLPRSL